MAKTAKTKTTKLPQADAGSIIPPADIINISSPKPPAPFINNADVSWGGGIVRLDLSEIVGEDPADARAAVVMTAQQARLLADILNQAADAILPVE